MITKSGCHAKTIAVNYMIILKSDWSVWVLVEIFQDLALRADQRVPRLWIGEALSMVWLSGYNTNSPGCGP